MVLSDLRIVLIGAGVIAVAAVWVYNVWQERKLHRLSKTFFTHPQSDALINLPDAEKLPDGQEMQDPADGTQRREPTFSSSHENADDVIESSNESATEELPTELIETWSSQGSMPTQVALPAEWADNLTHCVVQLNTSEPIPATTLWVLQAGWAAQLDKPLCWMAYDDATASWMTIDESVTSQHLQWAAALQLADRRGAISENTLTHFFNGMHQLADQVDTELTLPDLASVAAHAAALDAFCANVDIQFKVYIVESAGGVFSGTKLRGVAEASGMLLENDGCFRARDPAGEELFTLVNLGSEAFTLDNLRSLVTHGLSLSLDVPRVSDGPATFARMLTAAQQLARALDGVLVDAQRMPLTDVMISAIRTKIIELQQTMREAGIVPGSPRAKRLFS
jgi:FtsZ-interacting cell division protein ZipA